MISQNPIFYNRFLYKIFNFVFFSGVSPFKPPLQRPFPRRFCLPFSVLRRNGIRVLFSLRYVRPILYSRLRCVCGSLFRCSVLRCGSRLPSLRRSGVGGLPDCRLSCGIGLGRVLFRLHGLFFFLCLLGKRAVLQGKVGIGDIHHQITGTGTVAAVLNGDADGDLRIVRRQVSHHHSVQIVLA